MNASHGAAASSTSDDSPDAAASVSGTGLPVDESQPLEPAEMFALLTNQQRAVAVKMGGFVPAIMAGWGVAWLIGFTALWLIDGLKPAFSLPAGLAIGIFIGVLVIAIGVSIWLGVRSNRGVKSNNGADAFAGTVYGVTWSVGSIALGAIGGALIDNGLSSELANLFYPSVFVFFVGIMYVMAGAIWKTVSSVVIGGWLVVIAAVAPFIGYPWHYLFFAIAGGVGLLLFAILGRNLLNGSSSFGTAGASRGA
jgi:hypothetical protein